MQHAPLAYPVRFSVDRPDRELNLSIWLRHVVG
jgi:hypothetical protein